MEKEEQPEPDRVQSTQSNWHIAYLFWNIWMQKVIRANLFQQICALCIQATTLPQFLPNSLITQTWSSHCMSLIHKTCYTDLSQTITCRRWVNESSHCLHHSKLHPASHKSSYRSNWHVSYSQIFQPHNELYFGSKRWKNVIYNLLLFSVQLKHAVVLWWLMLLTRMMEVKGEVWFLAH